MRIIIAPKAIKQLQKINGVDRIAIIKKIRSLKSTNPLTHSVKLSGYKNSYRLRVGHYRIVYRLELYEIQIILVGHRKDVYSLLRRNN